MEVFFLQGLTVDVKFCQKSEYFLGKCKNRYRNKNNFSQKGKLTMGAEDMKLNNDYPNNRQDLPTINMMVGEEVEKYRGRNRGQGWDYPYPRHIPIHGHPPKKMFCTVNYPLAKEKQTVAFLQAKNNLAQVHKINLCDILERRCLIAKARGDQKLLSLLEDEWQYMCCG